MTQMGETTLTGAPDRAPGAAWRRAVLSRLSRLERGTLAVEDGGESLLLGRPCCHEAVLLWQELLVLCSLQKQL